MNLCVKIAAESLIFVRQSMKKTRACNLPAQYVGIRKPARLFLEAYLSALVEDHRLIHQVVGPMRDRGAVGKRSTIHVEVVGSQIACSQGLRDDWRELTEWIGSKLDVLYEGRVTTSYFDLFDENRLLLPVDAKLPVVMVNHEVISMGGKISMGLIRKKIDVLINTNK